MKRIKLIVEFEHNSKYDFKCRILEKINSVPFSMWEKQKEIYIGKIINLKLEEVEQ